MQRIRWAALLLSLAVAAVINSSSRTLSAASMVGGLSGRVTDQAGTTGLANTKIRIFNVIVEEFTATTTTNGNGDYSVNLPAGSYAVLTDNTLGFINEIWNDIPCSAVCDTNSVVPIDVTTNLVTGIDFALSPGGRVSGTVTSSVTGLPIAGVSVRLANTDAQVDFTGGVTNASGVFTTDGGSVAGNVYGFTQNTAGYQNEAYDNVKCDNCDPSDAGTPFAVAGSGITPGMNFALDPGGTMSGTVTDSNGAPLANVFIEITNSTFTASFGTQTDASGNFITGGMPSGTYFASTFNVTGHVNKAFDGLLCPQGGNPEGFYCNTANGTPISVSVGSNVPNINFSLPLGGQFSGAVTNAVGGAPVVIGSGGISIYNSLGVFVLNMFTDGTGHYTTPGLPPGTYYAQTTNVPGFGNNLYSNIPCANCSILTGTPIVVTAANTTPNINFSLSAAGTITGTLTQVVGGATINNANVQVLNTSGAVVANANTNGSGFYSISNLAAGSYYVRTNQGGQFMNEVYNDILCQQCAVTTSGAQLIAVAAGATVGNINFALAAGGRISGFVTNANGGAAIQSVPIQLFNSQNVSMGTFNTFASGQYTTVGVPAGTYYVRTQNNLGFINELYDNISCPAAVCQAIDGTGISVTLGAITSNINFALNAGGKITGQVTTAGGVPLPNMSVQLVNSVGRVMGLILADSLGNYSTPSLPDGQYYLRSANSSGFIDEVYDAVPCIPNCVPLSGDAVEIASGANVPGINFGLSVGGTISGTVRDAGTLAPLSNVPVAAYASTGQIARSGVSVANGVYTIAGLPPGSYFLRTVNNSGYYDDIFEDLKFCGTSCLVTDGTSVAVTVGNTTSNIDFDLTPSVEKTQNGTFANGLTNWDIFAQPNNPADLVGKLVNGTFQYYRTPGSTAGVILQHTHTSFASGAGIIAQFDLLNTSDVRKRISVLVHEGDFSDIAVCTFWIPPNQGVRRYAMQTHTTKAWNDATISLYAATTGSNGGAYQLDNVTLQPAPGVVEDTECVDPFKPPLGNGPPGPELLTNGDFSTGVVAPWSTPFDITFQISGGVFEFIRPNPGSTGIAGVLQQNTGAPVASGDILTADFQLGNSSGVVKRVTVLLLDPNFSDLSACTFWLQPGQPLSQYRMRSYATKVWSQAAIAIFPATVGNEQWIRIDNISLKKTPAAHIAGTDCLEPPVGPEPPPQDDGIAAASMSSGGAALAGGSGAGVDPATGVELSITTDANGATPLTLQPIDLRQSSSSSLHFESRRGHDVSSAEIQVSLDGHTWQTVAEVPPSDEWLSIDVDLSSFAGQILQVRFVMDAEVSAGRPQFSRWQIRRFAIY